MSVQLFPALNMTVLDEGGGVISALGVSVSTLTDYYVHLLQRGLLLTTNPIDSPSAAPVVTPPLMTFATANVKDFGALGNNQQTLIADSYTSDTPQTQQTVDGAAINKAIRYLRASGGGTLYIPRGVYRTWGYLETLDFSIRVVGDGVDATILRTCDTAPTNVDAFGVMRVGQQSVYNLSSGLITVSLENLTLDGNSDVRATPTSEWRSAVLAVYGAPALRLTNITCVNGSLDCMLVDAETPVSHPAVVTTDTAVYVQAVNCTFSNSFRNSVSLTGGWNQSYTNCVFAKGGASHGGTNPRACLDIEPNLPSLTIKNLNFIGCTFYNAGNQLVSCVWAGQVKLQSCAFRPVRSANGGSHWPLVVLESQMEVQGCTFTDTTNYDSYILIDTPYNNGEYSQTQYVAIRGCSFEGVGLYARGQSLILENSSFLNSLYPVHAQQTTMRSFVVRNVKLTNVIDKLNYGTGTTAAFAINNSCTNIAVDVDGLLVNIDAAQLPAGVSFANVTTLQTGVYFPSGTAKLIKLIGVGVGGYYKQLPNAYGQAYGPSFTDWGGATTVAPADSAGVTAGPGSIYYKNCTEYGNSL